MSKGFRNPMGGGGNVLKQVKQLQEQMQAAQEQLKMETVTAGAGGGVVNVTMTGDQVCKAVKINPDLIKDADVEMLQDLVQSAVNAALEKSRELAAQKLGPLAGGMPGLGL